MFDNIWFWIIFILSVIVVLYLIYKYVTYYPSLTIEIDISRKQKMNKNDLLDYYIINYGTHLIEKHVMIIKKWKEKKILKFNENTFKITKFNNKCNKINYKSFKFIAFREKTRYRQMNYKKYPYKVRENDIIFFISDEEILRRIKFLKEHDFYVTYNNYNREDQRKALTKELRLAVMKRDNYTCKLCGKRMLDEVGLHIDHIIPIAKGGKSIPSNLRVLCSKCNGSKGSK